MLILGIETSCDESAASVIQVNKRSKDITVLSNIISSQIDIHKQYGGVVPEVAAREHVFNLLPTIKTALNKSKKEFKDLDLIAVTEGPGLITSLITGVETARILSYTLNIPVLGVHHIKGHLHSPFIDDWKNIEFPALALTVSGGHTNLIILTSEKKHKLIGQTRDDAAGEAFDKGAKMMGLSYPGGPIISKLAKEFIDSGKKSTLKPFPRPMVFADNYDFSFSGLKTSLLYRLKKDDDWKNRKTEYAYMYQEAIVDTLVKKTIKAAKTLEIKNILLAGGVSANTRLREELKMKARDLHLKVFIPKMEYTTDNATMIAVAGIFSPKQVKKDNWKRLSAQASLDLK